jgi:hypothetical protein
MSYRGNTDRRFNDYHYNWPKDWWYIDLDGLEVCSRCREPLLLYEVSRDSEKPTSIIRKLASKAGVPAVLVIVPDAGETFDDSTVVNWRWVGSWVWHEESLGTFQATVAELRQKHAEAHAVLWQQLQAVVIEP